MFKTSLKHAQRLESMKSPNLVVLLPKSRLESANCNFTKWVKSQPAGFGEDFKRNKSGWLYNDTQKIFIQEHELKEDAKVDATSAALYKLGSGATQALNSKKAKEADIWIASEFKEREIGSYLLSSTLMNYKFSQKEDVWDSETKEEEKAEKSVKPVLMDRINFNTEGNYSNLQFSIQSALSTIYA